MGDGHLAMLVIVHKIKPPQKNRRWKNNQNDLSICGPIAEKYFVKIFSFVYDKGQEKLIKLRTRSSSINTFNKKIKKYKQVQVKLHSIEKRMRETLKKVQKLKRAKEVL